MSGFGTLIPLATLAAVCLCGQGQAIRVWGSVQMRDLMQNWERSYSRTHPEIRFENRMNGAVSAIAGVYTGVADLALSREIWPSETMAFEQVLGYKPTAIEVATGSFDVPTKSDSLEIFVHQSNPISRLSLPQLARVFGAGPSPTWGELGLKGEWADKQIHAYGFQTENAGALFFSDVVMNGSRSWSCTMKGFANRETPKGGRLDAGALILDALSNDESGIAISNIHYARTEVKTVAVGLTDAGPFIEPTKQSVRNRTYPLSRVVYVYLNRAPRKPLDSHLADFLTYVLSEQGQADVAMEGAYLPLTRAIAEQQLVRLR